MSARPWAPARFACEGRGQAPHAFEAIGRLSPLNEDLDGYALGLPDAAQIGGARLCWPEIGPDPVC